MARWDLIRDPDDHTSCHATHSWKDTWFSEQGSDPAACLCRGSLRSPPTPAGWNLGTRSLTEPEWSWDQNQQSANFSPSPRTALRLDQNWYSCRARIVPESWFGFDYPATHSVWGMMETGNKNATCFMDIFVAGLSFCCSINSLNYYLWCDLTVLVVMSAWGSLLHTSLKAVDLSWTVIWIEVTLLCIWILPCWNPRNTCQRMDALTKCELSPTVL